MDNLSVEQLVRLELRILDADMHDTNVIQALACAQRLDTMPTDTDLHVAHGLAKKLNERLLALQHPYWQGTIPLPARLQEVMHQRAAAVYARVPRRPRRDRMNDARPPGIPLVSVSPNLANPPR